MIASIIDNSSIIKNISLCKDVNTTIECLRLCNILIFRKKEFLHIKGGSLTSPKSILNCKNSGSTVRMLLGLLCGQKIAARFNGDNSLRSRPMNRIISPLKNMGIQIKSNNKKLPIMISPKQIKSTDYLEQTTSAQVKSAILFAALGSNDYSSVAFNKYTRDHTEKIMASLGFNVRINNNIKIKRSFINKGFTLTVPGDISNAANIIAAAILIPGSNVTIKNILYNKTRLGFIEVLSKMGAKIKISNISKEKNGEKTCDINALHSKNLKSIDLSGDTIIGMIDEIPIFCIVAVFADGISTIRDAKELRVKESDRILAIYENLKKMNADICQTDDGLIIKGGNKLHYTSIKHYNDHRIAMSFEVLRLILGYEISGEYKDIIRISFPEFYEIFNRLLQ